MIRRLLLVAWGLGRPAFASAQAPETSEPGPEAEADEPEDPLSPYRTPFQVLTNRTIGSASQPVAFNWRRTRVHFAATGGFLFELNTFNSARVGGLVRIPARKVLLEAGVTYNPVWDSVSSRQIAETRFRQPGRPSRIEIDFAVDVPLAEGVVTVAPKWFPSVQLVFNGLLGLRYAIYPAGFRNLRAGQVAGAIVSPGLTPEEIDNLESVRLEGMAVDPARYGLYLGISNDLYFERGVFVTPRVIAALPLFAPVTESQLPFWLDVSLAVGIAI